jgi:hypothetical protein
MDFPLPIPTAMFKGVQLQDYLQATSSEYLNYLMGLTALSLISMSLLQAAKNLLYVRYFFQRRFLTHWLQRQAATAHQRLGLTSDSDAHLRLPSTSKIWKPSPERIVGLLGPGTGLSDEEAARAMEKPVKAKKSVKAKKDDIYQINRLARRAEQDIVLLAADGNAVALCDADGDEFCKHLGAVAQLVVDFPSEYRVLLGTIACNMEKEDYHLLIGDSAGAPGRTAAQAQAHSRKPAQPDEDSSSARQKWLDAKNRVRMQAVQSISAFQLRNSWTWGALMGVASFLISFVLALLALKQGANQSFADFLFAPATLGTALLAAFLAPVARDLVAAIEKLRS